MRFIGPFHRPFGASLGWPMQRLDIGFTLLVVAVIVLGLQSVGVVLMSALLVAPAAAARQWVDGLGAMVLLAAALGAVAGVSGTLLSALWAGLATGPLIVLCASILVLVSLLWAPRRGIVWRQLDRLAAQARLR